MISHFSVLSAIASYSGVLCIVCVLRRRTELLERVGASVLLLASSFASVRLLLPFELPQSFLIRSWDVLGPLPRLARAYPAVGSVPGGVLGSWGVRGDGCGGGAVLLSP